MTSNRIKLLTISLILSFTTILGNQSFAGVDGSPFEGLYAGIASVKNTFSATATHQVIASIAADTPSNFAGIASATSSNSYGGGLFGGYGLDYGPIYLGAEAAFIVDKGNTVFSDGTNTIKLSKSNTFDVSLRAGTSIADKVLLFGLVGYSGASVKSRGINDAADNSLDYNQRLTSLRYGGGIEVSIMENIAAKIEYTRSKMGDGVFLTGSDQFTFTPKTSRIMFSLVLHMY